MSLVDVGDGPVPTKSYTFYYALLSIITAVSHWDFLDT